MIENTPDVENYPEYHNLDEIEYILTKSYNPASEIPYIKIINQGQNLNIDFDQV